MSSRKDWSALTEKTAYAFSLWSNLKQINDVGKLADKPEHYCYQNTLDFCEENEGYSPVGGWVIYAGSAIPHFWVKNEDEDHYEITRSFIPHLRRYFPDEELKEIVDETGEMPPCFLFKNNKFKEWATVAEDTGKK